MHTEAQAYLYGLQDGFQIRTATYGEKIYIKIIEWIAIEVYLSR